MTDKEVSLTPEEIKLLYEQLPLTNHPSTLAIYSIPYGAVEGFAEVIASNQLAKVRKHRLDRPELRAVADNLISKAIHDVLVEVGIASYTSIAQAKLDRININLQDQILALIPDEKDIRRQERERIINWLDEPCDIHRGYKHRRYCKGCWQALKKE